MIAEIDLREFSPDTVKQLKLGIAWMNHGCQAHLPKETPSPRPPKAAATEFSFSEKLERAGCAADFRAQTKYQYLPELRNGYMLGEGRLRVWMPGCVPGLRSAKLTSRPFLQAHMAGKTIGV